MYVFLQVSKKRKNRNKKFFSAQGESDNGGAQSSKRPKFDEPVEVNNSSSHSTPQSGNTKGIHGKRKWQEEGFQPFDYSKVNFSRFQGGSNIYMTSHKNEGKPKVSWMLHNLL